MEHTIYKELLNLAEQRNITIFDDLLGGENLNGLYTDYQGTEFIALNKRLVHDPIKRNFVLAHELGHSELHRGKGDMIQQHSKEIESQADMYADNLITVLTEQIKSTENYI